MSLCYIARLVSDNLLLLQLGGLPVLPGMSPAPGAVRPVRASTRGGLRAVAAIIQQVDTLAVL